MTFCMFDAVHINAVTDWKSEFGWQNMSCCDNPFKSLKFNDNTCQMYFFLWHMMKPFLILINPENWNLISCNHLNPKASYRSASFQIRLTVNPDRGFFPITIIEFSFFWYIHQLPRISPKKLCTETLKSHFAEQLQRGSLPLIRIIKFLLQFQHYK